MNTEGKTVKKIETTAVDGTQVSFHPNELHHRCDETFVGLRTVTAFIDGHILWTMVEAEMRAFLTLTVMKKSQQSEADYNENAAWMYSIEALLSQVIRGTGMSAKSHAIWSRLSQEAQETHLIHVELVAMTAFAEYLAAKHFEHVGNPLTGSYDVATHATILPLKFIHPLSDEAPLIRWR